MADSGLGFKIVIRGGWRRWDGGCAFGVVLWFMCEEIWCFGKVESGVVGGEMGWWNGGMVKLGGDIGGRR